MKGFVPLVVLLTVVLAACGGDDAPSAPTTTEPVTLELQKLSKETTDSTVEVRGTVTEGARVTVNGKRAEVRGERFSISLPLDVGKNEIRVVATRPSFEEAQELARVTRTQPAPTQSAESPAAPSGADPAPTGPNPNCPPGQVPAGITGACAPSNKPDANEASPEEVCSDPELAREAGYSC